ncbi:MAG: 50S ribosomal protein L5 [Rickettsiales bacterium]|jgi:large subunit ribosomal protein L5|nr:50S ribosomal protein L5 [Rickettsiales bacterium]MBC37231.1 50S ribosomal protein L5 [Rickettsiales bacterium]PPR40286.1 MAG: 50S ribosomal protein L5 [Alphaproteobacteria bacterium MarineAlpha7_Bin1]HAE76007.1 50S ribosomal protein L5 [Alphaproteobacteria bacterium]|tara:strand:- start:282 stop:818 length:537 start_codon:yes stop_codon:yes gene_type:complete
MVRLEKFYNETVRANMMKKFSYKNPLSVPRLEKIVMNMCIKEATQDTKKLDSAFNDMKNISGQRPAYTFAKTSISNFKLREGQKIGCMVTLRKKIMYEFLDRFINIALPRVRDFRGLSPKSFDGKGNFSIGLKEQITFPEINFDKVDTVRGMDITFVTTAGTDEEGKELLKQFNMPIN